MSARCHPVTRTTTWIAFLVVHSGLLAAQTNSIEAWVTNPDRSPLFQKLPSHIPFRAAPARGTGHRHRPGAAHAIHRRLRLRPHRRQRRAAHENERPPRAPKSCARSSAATATQLGVSYLRLTIGASDLNSFVYSYDDLPPGETDPELKKFDLGQDRQHVLPVLKEILAIAPGIKILALPVVRSGLDEDQ